MCDELLLSLEVLASTSIKRKKSWSQIIWLGKEEEEEAESLILLDPQRISLLSIPHGQTKKNLPKVSSLVAESLHVNASSNSVYLVGLLQDGVIFLWKKEVDTLWLIQGLHQYVDDWETNQASYRVFVSNDATKILVVAGSGHVYVWLLSMSSQVEHNSKQQNLDGCWYPVEVPIKFRGLFKERDKLSLASSIFFSNQVLGCCCNCSFMVYTKKKLNIVTLHLNYLTAALSSSSSFYPFVSDWMSIEYDRLNLSVSDMRGPPVASYTHDGQILALAINRIVSSPNKMLFLSPFTNTSVMSSIKNYEEDQSQSMHISYYWVTDMAWTYDDLFLACILRSGSVCIMPRLGEPILLQTSGLSVDMGPAYFLPLHPVITVSEITKPPATSNGANSLNMQKLSVSSHPHLPVILVSDGFLVTVLKILHNLTCSNLICNVVLKSSKQLSVLSREYSLDLSQATASQTQLNHEYEANREADRTTHWPFNFENSRVSLCSQDGELSPAENDTTLKNIRDRKIVFGIVQSKNADPVLDCNRQRTNPEILKSAYSNLLLAWKLQVTSGCIWSSAKERAVKQTLQNMTKLFIILLDVPEMSECFDNQQNPGKSGLFCLIRIFKEFLDLLRFDFLFQRFVSIIATFVHKTIKLILCSEKLAQFDPPLKTLLGCEALLQFSTQSMKKVYTWSPKYLPSAADIEVEPESEDNSWYEPMKKNEERSDVEKRNSFRDNFSIQDIFCLHELLPTWRLLMKHAKMKAAEIRNVSNGTDEGLHDTEEKGHTQILVQLFQRLNTRLFSRSSSMQDIKKKPRPISKGDHYSLESMHTLAEDAWKEQLVAMKGSSDTKSRCNILHSLLYTYLLRGQLTKAMEMVETLIVKGDVSTEDVNSSFDSITPLFFTVINSSQSSQEERVPCIKDPAIRKVVQSLARFMTLYFCNKQLFIFPPNSPSPIPVVYKAEQPDLTERIIPKYQQDITSVITSSGLDDIWTVDRCMEYLLLSGLVPEAAWFAERIGDWKAALIISAAYLKHKAMFPDVYRSESMELVLPDDLRPSAILQKKLTTLLHFQNGTGTVGTGQELTKDIFNVHDENCLQQLTTTLTSVFTAGILCDVDVVSWLFPALVDSLKELVQTFSANVPVEFHLPAPPYYLWQPTDTIQLDSSELKTPFMREKECRHSASTFVRLILAVLQSSKLALPLIRWYILQLRKIYKKVIGKFEDDIDGPVTQLPDFLENLGEMKFSLSGLSSTYEEVSTVLASFRSFCALLWFLHVRDNVSNYNRQRRAYVENHSIKITKNHDEHWSNLCHENLIWAVHFLPFSHFLHEEKWPYKVLLSLLAEIPASVHTAQILATHCYNTDELDPEVQETLEVLLKRWQTITVSSTEDGIDSLQESRFGEEDYPRRKSLSVYFQEYCCTVKNILKQKKKCFGKYTEFLFESENEGLIIGSFPFETSKSYIKFLDMFFDVSFLKQIEDEMKSGSKHSIPLIKTFAKKIEKLQMESMPFRTMTGRHPKQNLLILSSPCKNATSQRNQNINSPSFHMRSKSVDQAMSVRSKGLFRSSQSVDSLCTNQGHSLTPLSAREKRQIWSASKTKPMEAASPSTQARSSESLSEKNERTLWSFNGQFGPRYFPLNQLVDWMILWARKSEVLLSQLDKNNNREIKSAIHIEIQPQLLVLALWLIQEKYHPPILANSHVMSVTFSPRLTEVFTEKKIHESRIVPKMRSTKMQSKCSEEKESSDTFIPGFDKNKFKKWLRNQLIHEPQEVENDVDQVSFCSPSTISQTQLQKSLVKNVKKQKKTAWDSLPSHDEDQMKQAYERILQTIDEINSTTDDLDATNLPELEISDQPQTEISSQLLTTGNSITLSHLIDTATFTNSVLSESRQSAGSETVDVSFKSRAVSHGMQMKRKKRQTCSVKSDTMSTNKETGESIVQVNYREGNIQRILQHEIQKLITVQNERLLSVMGAMLNTDPILKRQSKKNRTTKTEAPGLPENVDFENQRPKKNGFSVQTSNSYDQRLMGDSVGSVTKSEISSKTTSRSIGNMRGILKELENLKISANAEGAVKTPPKVKTNRQLKNKRDIKGNITDYITENISPDIISEKENHISNKSPEKMYLISKDDSSPKYSLTEIEKFPKQSHHSLPQVNEASLNKPQVCVPGCIKIPLLSLKREHKVFEKNQIGVSIPEIQIFDYKSHQSKNLPNQNLPLPQNLTHKTFVNHHNMINSYLQQMPDENHFNLFYFNQKSSSYQQQQLLSQEKAPLPLLQVPKEGLTPSWPDFQIRLIPPQLIADFQSHLFEKDLEKRQYFENFQQNQLKKLAKEEKQTPVQSEPMPLLVAHLGKKESKTATKEFVKNSEISPSKDELTVLPEKRHYKQKETAVQNSKEESEDLQEKPPLPLQSADSKSLISNSVQPKVTDETPVNNEEYFTNQIDHGFIMRPGAFDNYLKLGAQLGVPTENYANIQHDLATRLQRLRHESKKVDFSTMTKEMCDASMETDPAMEEQARTAEAVTSITKDTGCDPVIEAMMAYNRVVQSSFLSPDIYLKLHSNDSKDVHKEVSEIVDKSTKEKDESTKLTFLNVVDIPCSVVMSKNTPTLAANEITQPQVTTALESLSLFSKSPHKETQPMLLNSDINQHVTEAWVDEEAIFVKESSKMSVPQMQVSSSPDLSPEVTDPLVPSSVTDKGVGLLKSNPKLRKTTEKKESVRFRFLENYTKSKNLQESSKDSLSRELRHMDHQIALMDELALKMEEEYHRTKLFSHRMDALIALEPELGGTLDQDAAVIPEESCQISRFSSSPYHSKPPPSPSDKSQITRWSAPATSGKKNSQQLGSKVPMKISVPETKNQILMPHLSTQPPTQRKSLHSDTDQIKNQKAEKIMNLSDLSGVSDIIADLIGKGDINLTDVGLMPEDIEQFTDKISTRPLNNNHMMQMSLEKLTQMARESEANNNNNNNIDQRQELRQLMSHRQNQNRQEYQNKQEILAQEKQLFSKKQQPMPSGKIEKEMKSRQENRKELQHENWDRRVVDAEKLILNFKIDQQQAKMRISPSSSPRNAKKSSNVFSKRKKTIPQTTTRLPLQEKNFTSTRTITHSAFFREQQKTENFELAEMRDLDLESTEYDFMNIEHPRSDIPQPNLQLMCTSDPVLAHADHCGSPLKETQKTNPAQRPYQEIVRLQRPEITRKALVKDQKPYVERLKEMTKKNLQSPRSVDKQKLYEGKKMPTGQVETLVIQREVKSYSERLQEIKRCAKRDESTPIVPQQLCKPPNASKPIAGTTKMSPKILQHQPVPYVERLRQLSNRGTYTAQDRLPMTTITLKRTPTQRRHTGPPHKPKTYVQQLQAVNAAAKFKQDSASSMLKITKERTSSRRHPYANPYSFSDGRSTADVDSVSDISEWILDDKIKDILYGNQEIEDATTRRLSESGSDYYDELFPNSARQVESFCATSTVNSDDVSSHIDWVSLEKGLSEQMNDTDPQT